MVKGPIFSPAQFVRGLKGKRVMVLGGAGFIGSHLCEALLEEGVERLTIVDNLFLGSMENLQGLAPYGDLKDRVHFYPVNANSYQELAPLLSRPFDLVYNLAVLPLPHSLDAPELNVAINTAIVTNLCELQRHGAFETLVHFSSSEAYGSARYEPMDEDHPLGPSTPYAAAKAAGDLIVQSYAQTFGLKSAILRPFNVYGPRQNARSYAGVIPLTVGRIWAKHSPIIYGDGSQTRDYSFVRDVAQAALAIFKCTPRTTGQVINMGAGRETSIIVLVMLISQIMTEMGYPEKRILFDKPRPGDVRRHIANVFRARDLMGYEPDNTIPLLEGLRQTIAWYIDVLNRGGKK